MPVGRTSPSTRFGERLERPADVPSRRRRQRPRRRSTALRLTLQPLARRQRRQRPRCRPTVPVPVLVSANRSSDAPAVAYDGDLDVIRRTPGSRSRPADRRSTLRALGNSVGDPDVAQGSAVPSRQRGGSTHDAKLHFAKQSHLRHSANSLSAHCRALSQLAEHVRRLHTLFVARLFYSCLAVQHTCVLTAV